jgi:hypothetical protein
MMDITPTRAPLKLRWARCNAPTCAKRFVWASDKTWPTERSPVCVECAGPATDIGWGQIEEMKFEQPEAMTKPTLDEMIDAAAKLPPGPDAWNPIFHAYPEVTPDELIEKFRQSAARAQREAEELRAYARQRAGN